MGYYINPKEMSKEDFLAKYGVIVHPSISFGDIPKDCLIVCWVHNEAFTAVAIAYSPRELEEFQRKDDLRPKKFFVVEKSELRRIGCEWPE